MSDDLIRISLFTTGLAVSLIFIVQLESCDRLGRIADGIERLSPPTNTAHSVLANKTKPPEGGTTNAVAAERQGGK